MNPALSVVFFTVLAGLGQGLAVSLAAAVLTGLLAPASSFLGWGLAAAILLLAAGLLSSFLHLGRPERAWRAAAMWRTSWLSREVIALPAFIGLLVLWWLALRAGDWPAALGPWLAAATIAMALVLWLCTAMIYACIRFIQEWAHPLTVVNYALIGLSSGLVLACCLAAAMGESRLLQALGPFALAATLIAGAARFASFERNAHLRPASTLQSATGIRARTLTQLSMGMSAGSFNTREFFHGVADASLRHLRLAALLGAFVLPAGLMVLGLLTASPVPWLAALALQVPGLLVERWVFFAQARHPQNLYYQRVS
jgi:DMSO reductase anchor subunit